MAAANLPISGLNLVCESKSNCYDRVVTLTTNQPTTGAFSSTGTLALQSNGGVTVATCDGGAEYRAFMKVNYKSTTNVSTDLVGLKNWV